MKNRLLTVFTACALAALGWGAYTLYERTFSNSFDTELKTALQSVQTLHTYEMLDETHASISGRTIDIYGLYSLDFDAGRYSAVSTTTLTLLEDKPPKNKHSFTLQHRVIGTDVYVKIETQSPLLKGTIPNGPEWKHFAANAIPDRFVDIAVPGPILDNLSLLSKNGAYLSLRGKPVVTHSASSTYRVYTFTLSKKTTEVTSGPLKSLVDQVATGTVDIWIDETPRVRFIHLQGEGYRATSTILSVNTSIAIEAPALTE